MEFIPYKSNETLENRYYQISQELFENSLYKDKQIQIVKYVMLL